VRVLSSTKVNELRYGWNRFAEGFFPQDQNFDPSSIGLCNVPVTFPSCHSSGLPIILLAPTPTGASGFFSQLGATSGDPRARVDTNNQLLDSFSWKMNKHEIKFGENAAPAFSRFSMALARPLDSTRLARVPAASAH
jgi:hypothetical protein